MRRRDFLAAVGGAAAWPWPATAQPRRVPTIGYLYAGSLDEGRQENVEAFHRGLAETGWVEGRNVRFEFRAAKGDVSLLPELARDLVRRQVDVILAPGSGLAAQAARAATATIPIVFSNAGDPIRSGLVDEPQPSGRQHHRRRRFRHCAVGQAAGADPAAASGRLRGRLRGGQEPAAGRRRDRQCAGGGARARHRPGRRWVNTIEETDAAFATLAERRVDAVCLVTNLLFFGHRERVVGLAARHRLPTVYPFIQYTQSGGLMSYGSSLMERAYQAGVYVGLILNGQKPGDLPIRRLTKFELAINLTTAKTLGLTVPSRFLALTDKVIE